MLIVDMPMPKNCEQCPLTQRVYSDCENFKLYCLVERKEIIMLGIPVWCPIKGELPDEHGDLIDRDAVKTRFENKKSTIQNRIMGVQMDSIAIAFYEIFIEAIDKQPTIIVAERKDE